MMSTTIFAILVIMIVAVLAIVIAAWLIMQQQSSRSISAKTDAKTQPIVQQFYSHDLQKRSFIVRRNDEQYKVVFQYHSEKVINLRREIEGWVSLPKKPITGSLVKAVEIAKDWVEKEG